MDFQAFLSDNYGRACRFVRSYVTDDAAAEDIVAEGMLAFWKNRNSVRDDAALSYLYTILRNKALDHLRKERAHRMVSLSGDADALHDLDIRISSLNETPPEKIFSKEVSRIIRATIRALPERTRAIFEAHRFGDKSYAEIASVFDITDKGVEYHIGKALQALRTALKDYLPAFLFLYP